MAAKFSRFAMKTLLPITMLMGAQAYAQQRPRDAANDSCDTKPHLKTELGTQTGVAAKTSKTVVLDEPTRAEKRKERKEERQERRNEYDGELTNDNCLMFIAQRNYLLGGGKESNRANAYAFGVEARSRVWQPGGTWGGHAYIKALAFTGEAIGREDVSSYDIYGDPRWKDGFDKVQTIKGGYAVGGGGADFCFMRNKHYEPRLTMDISVGFGAVINNVYANHAQPDKTKARFAAELYARTSFQLTNRIGLQASLTHLYTGEQTLMGSVGVSIAPLYKKLAF